MHAETLSYTNLTDAALVLVGAPRTTRRRRTYRQPLQGIPEASWSAVRAKDTYLAAKFWRASVQTETPVEVGSCTDKDLSSCLQAEESRPPRRRRRVAEMNGEFQRYASLRGRRFRSLAAG
jgi:hypothetical protein